MATLQTLLIKANSEQSDPPLAEAERLLGYSCWRPGIVVAADSRGSSSNCAGRHLRAGQLRLLTPTP